MEWTSYEFTRTFIAGLCLRGVRNIQNRENFHHRQFRAVALMLEWEQRPVASLFVPDADGVYVTFDESLERLQNEHMVEIDPLGGGIKLTLGSWEARAIFESREDYIQTLIKQYVAAFLDPKELESTAQTG